MFTEGPKNYGYRVKTAEGELKTVIKVRGFTLNHLTRHQLNFDTMKNFILNREPIRVTNKFNICRKRLFNVVTEEITKVYKTVTPKRRKLDNFKTCPFGFINNDENNPNIINSIKKY